MISAYNWVAAHWSQILIWLGIASVVASTVATGLSRYPGEPGRARAGFIAFFKTLAEILSLVQHYDSEGSLKAPGARSNPPAKNGVNHG